MKSQTVKEARAGFASLVQSAETVVLTRRGKPVGAFVPLAQLELLQKQLDRVDRRANLIFTLSQCLQNQPHVLRAYLFGSWSRGDWKETSDVDVLVVLDDINEDEFWKCSKKVKRCLRQSVHRPFDVVVECKSKFNARVHEGMLEATIVKEGVALV